MDEKLKVLLLGISEELEQKDLQHLVYLCDLPTADKENIKDGISLFLCLKKRVLLLENNLSFLKEILLTIGRKDILKNKLYMDQNEIEGLQKSIQHISPYRALLYYISQNLETNDMHTLRFLWCPSSAKLKNTDSSLDLLSEMEKDGSLGKEDLKTLKKHLSHMGRKDLVLKIEEFEAKGGNQSTRRKPMQTQGEHTNSLQMLTWPGFEPETQLCKARALSSAMEESSRGATTYARKLPEQWEELSQLQRDIYNFLAEKGPQRALPIAKAVKKVSAKDVNPDLYKMMKLGVLQCDGDKLWTIRAHSCVTESALKTKHLNRTEPQEASTLTPQQNGILTFLKNNSKPMKAVDIAKGLGRTYAKDVKSDLYQMERMGHLAKQGCLWMVETKTRTSCDQDTNHISHNNHIPEVSTPTCNNSLSDCGKGTAACDLTVVDGPCVNPAVPADVTTQAQPDESTAPACYAGTMINKSYNIYIQNSQNVSVGDTFRFIDDQRFLAPSCVTESDTRSYTCVYSVTQTDTASQMPNAGDGCPENALTGISCDSGVGLQRELPKTSSPVAWDHVTPSLDISDLTNGLEQVTLDQSNGPDALANGDDIVL
ncbi:uncharacterized protein [Hyperolius riggenbachi]|uniref:uncharacterized protein isoform X2 n=1 Tax=Hyperolius riggenbachi TaxID=752182 RepID=UPI0035A29025